MVLVSTRDFENVFQSLFNWTFEMFFLKHQNVPILVKHILTLFGALFFWWSKIMMS